MMTHINKHKRYNDAHGVYRLRKWNGCGNYMRRTAEQRRYSRDEVMGWRACMAYLADHITPDLHSSVLGYWGRRQWKLFMRGRVSGYCKQRADMEVPLSRYTKRPDISTHKTS